MRNPLRHHGGLSDPSRRLDSGRFDPAGFLAPVLSHAARHRPTPPPDGFGLVAARVLGDPELGASDPSVIARGLGVWWTPDHAGAWAARFVRCVGCDVWIERHYGAACLGCGAW